MARTFTVALSCKCGSSLAVDGRSHRVFGRSLIHSFTQLHNQCVTSASDDVLEEPGGDVFSQLSNGPQHSEHELVTGFQRQLW